MMFEAAYLTAGGETFAVVAVEDSVIGNSEEAGKVTKQFEPFFRCPVLLMGAHNHRVSGREDLARYVRQTGYARLPWRKWSVAA